METKRRRDSGAPRADRTKKMCNLACSRLTDSGEDAKVFFFLVRALSIPRARQSWSLEQAGNLPIHVTVRPRPTVCTTGIPI